ncbi:MAG: serine hydrolase domain-containing protein [Hyphomicrobiaceae bacterium]
MKTRVPEMSLSRAEPSAVGLDAARLGRIRDALDRDVEAGLLPGAVVGVARRGHIAYLEAVGKRDPAGEQPMWADAVFSIASMTKPMTSVAIMMLHEEGRLLLGDPVSKFLPQMSNMRVAKSLSSDTLETVPAAREITIQDLLRHTSGLTNGNRGTSPAHRAYPQSGGSAALNLSREEFLDAIGKVPLLYQPGTAWEYGFSTDVLGHVVEAISGQSLGAFLKTRLWDPIGMVDTSFSLSKNSEGRYARAFPNCPLTGEPLTVLHASGKPLKWDSGGGGAVSTAADYLRFVEMLRAGGTFSGTRLLSRKSVELMRADHLGPEIENRITTMDPACNGYGFGLGFAVRRTPGIAAQLGSVGDYYWSGVYGTYFWIDPVEDMAVVFMAAAPGQIRLRYRQLLRALVLQAVVD